MLTSICPSGSLERPFTKRAREGDAEGALNSMGVHGQLPYGRNMLLLPVGAGRDTALPGGLWLSSGQGDLGQRGVEVGGAQVLTQQHGDHHLAPSPAPGPPPITGACFAPMSGTVVGPLRAVAAVTSSLALGDRPAPDHSARSPPSPVACAR